MLKLWHEPNFVTVSWNPDRQPRWLVTEGPNEVTGVRKKEIYSKYLNEVSIPDTPKGSTMFKTVNTFDVIEVSYSLADLEKAAVPVRPMCAPPVNVTPKKKGKNMCYDCDMNGLSTISDAQIAKSYLDNRLDGAYYAKTEQFRKDFHLDNDNPPETMEEFVKRIQDGKFTVKDEYKKKEVSYTSPSRYITWRDPALKADQDGFDKAADAALKAKTEASDIIQVMDAKAGLEALKAFESATFH